MLDSSFWKDEAARAQNEGIKLARTVHYQRLALIVAAITVLGGWAGVGLLLTMLAHAAQYIQSNRRAENGALTRPTMAGEVPMATLNTTVN